MANRKTILAVWEKRKKSGARPGLWRRDMEGNKIRFASYGTRGDFGWESTTSIQARKVAVVA